MKYHICALIGAVMLLQTGCVVGRRTVALPVPTMGAASQSRGTIYIAKVVDGRKFENRPASPSTPSIDGDVATMTPQQLGQMIGRQRNTYGHAMGDIALPSGQSITERTRLLLGQALKRHGYEVVSASSAAQVSADVTVDEFWAWFTPGMWSVSFEARVYCTITLKRMDTQATIVVKGYGMNRGQVASDENWALAYDRAFADFISKFQLEIGKTSF